MKPINFLKSLVVDKMTKMVQLNRLESHVIAQPHALLSYEKNAIIITDGVTNLPEVEAEARFLASFYTASKIKVISIHAPVRLPLPQEIEQLTIAKVNASSVAELSRELVQFDPDICIIRTEKNMPFVKQLLLQTAPRIRISFGESYSFPYSNLRFPDPTSRLEDYFPASET